MTGFASMMSGINDNAAVQMQGARVAMAQKKIKNQQGLSSAAVDKAATDFTSVFMSQMLSPMFEGIQTDDTFGGGHGEEMMRGIMLQEMGKEMAKVDNTGLTDAVKAEMIRMQGGETAQAAS